MRSNKVLMVRNIFVAGIIMLMVSISFVACEGVVGSSPNPTVTAQDALTATVYAQATVTAGVIPTALAGQPDYADSLTNPHNGGTLMAQWDQNNHCSFESDGYHVTQGTILITGGGMIQGCLESSKQFQDFILQVDLTIISGHTGGVFFRIGQNLGAYFGYLFEVDNQGYYKISSSGNFSLGTNNYTFKEGQSSSLQTGTSAHNTLEVIAGKQTLSFYANNTLLAIWQDAAFTLGDIGFLATTSNGGASADMVYSNLKIYQLP